MTKYTYVGLEAYDQEPEEREFRPYFAAVDENGTEYSVRTNRNFEGVFVWDKVQECYVQTAGTISFHLGKTKAEARKTLSRLANQSIESIERGE